MTTGDDLDWLDHVNAPLFALNLEAGTLLRANPALFRILPKDLPEPPGPLRDFLGEGAASCILDFIRAMPDDGSRSTLSVTCPTANGPLMLIMHLKALPKRPDVWIATVDERTLFFHSVQSENAEETFRGIIQALPIGIDLFDSSWRGIFYNAYSDSLYLYDPFYDLEHHEWFERAFPDPAVRETARSQWDAAKRALEADPTLPQHIEWRALCRDGEFHVLSNWMSKIGTHYSFIYWDITEQRALEDKLRVLAATDTLTGAFNRRHFFACAEALLADSAALPLSLILLDIDHFKRVNDRHGHRAGDAALVAVAALCRAQARAEDILARFGGEEFILLLPRTSGAEAFGLAEALRAAIAAQPQPLASGSLRLTASLGVAAYAGPGESIDGLVERADKALYAAKRAGRDRVMMAAAPEVGPVLDTSPLSGN